MCTSLSHQQDYEGGAGSWYSGSCSSNRGGYELRDESSLQPLVQDLRSQLTRCHKVIRGLQLRVRSLSTTSDYASSLERTPRKVLQHSRLLFIPDGHFCFFLYTHVSPSTLLVG